MSHEDITDEQRQAAHKLLDSFIDHGECRGLSGPVNCHHVSVNELIQAAADNFWNPKPRIITLKVFKHIETGHYRAEPEPLFGVINPEWEDTGDTMTYEVKE